MVALRWDAVPADSIRSSPRSEDWCRRLFFNADVDTLAHVGFNCGVEADRSGDYSIPIFDDAEATTTRRVWLRPGYPGAFRAARGVKVPWNPKWRPSGGSDGHLVIVDRDGEWDLWAATERPSSWERFKAGTNTENWSAGYRGASNVILAASCEWVPYPTNGTAFVVGPLSAGVVRPAEVAAGRVAHAVKLVVGGQCSMVGPEAPEGIDIDDARIGNTHGVAVSPCSIFESRNLTGDLTRMVSDGRRFQVMLTRDECAKRLRASGLRGPALDTATTIAAALCVYGFFIGHTSKTRASFMGDGADPAAWRALGVESDRIADALFSSLIRSPVDLRCLDAPTATPPNGEATRRHARGATHTY